MHFDTLGDPEKIFWLQSAVLETAAVPMLLSSAISDRHVCVIRALFARLRPQAAWVGATQVIIAGSLNDVAGEVLVGPQGRDLRDVKGQERAKRALENAAAGRHHVLMRWSSRPTLEASVRGP